MRRLAVVVATGRVAAVFFEGDEMIGRCRSAKAFSSPTYARRIADHWVTRFNPSEALLEDAASMARKGRQSRIVTEAVASVFAAAECHTTRLRRVQRFANKYDEAKALAVRFPALQAIVPERPPIWLPEPREMSYFEAAGLVRDVLESH